MKVKYRLLQCLLKTKSVFEACYIKHVDDKWRKLYGSPHSECLMVLGKNFTKIKACLLPGMEQYLLSGSVGNFGNDICEHIQINE